MSENIAVMTLDTKSDGLKLCGRCHLATMKVCCHPTFSEVFDCEVKCWTDPLTEIPATKQLLWQRLNQITALYLLVSTLLRKQWCTDLISSPAP